MKIAINKKYKYLTFEEDCPKSESFETWVMQERFETHSILEIDDINTEYLRYDQFDYNVDTNSFVFNLEKYNSFIEKTKQPLPPSEKERLEALEQALLEIVLGGA